MVHRFFRARRVRHAVISILLACGGIFVLSAEAGAYIDPGTGSYILQLVIAGLLGSFFTVKLVGKRIKTFILGRFSHDRGARKDDRTGIDE